MMTLEVNRVQQRLSDARRTLAEAKRLSRATDVAVRESIALCDRTAVEAERMQALMRDLPGALT